MKSTTPLLLLALAATACDAPTAERTTTAPVVLAQPQPQALCITPPTPECDCEEPTEPSQPEAKNSGGSIVLPGITASRTTCASPCTVVFSMEDLEDPSVANTFTDLGTYWDYGDEGADAREGALTRGGDAHRVRIGGLEAGPSREYDVNTPLGAHTYTCTSEEDCTFYPGVAVQNPNGDWATAWTTITVQSAAKAYENTVCISNTGAFSECPEEATLADRLPRISEWASNTRYLVRGRERHAATCIPYGIENVLVEGYGDARPTVDRLDIGRDRNCNDPLPPSGERDVWNNNITVTGIRVGEIGMGMSFKDITLHDLDMDYEESSSMGGRIRTSSTDACTRQSQYNCDDIPTPQGLYVTDSVIRGSRSRPVGMNMEFLSSTCVSFFTAYNVEMSSAGSHNLRMECASRVLAIHNDVNGDHIGNRGPKNGITIRPEGYSRDDMLGAQRRSTADRSFQYGNRDVAVIDNYLGTPDGSGRNAARITIAPTKNSDAESTYRGLVSRNYSDLRPSAVPSNDVQLSGVDLVCYDDNRWQSNNGCQDRGPGATPASAYEPAIESQTPPAAPRPPASY